MKISKYQKEKRTKLKKKAVNLYKTGLTTREVAQVVGKSHQWVATAVRELSPVS